MWARRYGSSGSTFLASLAVATDPAGAIYVVGTYSGTFDFGSGVLSQAKSGDMFLVSYDANGAFRWLQAPVGAGSEAIHSVAADSTRVVVAGTFDSTLPIGVGVASQGSTGRELP